MKILTLIMLLLALPILLLSQKTERHHISDFDLHGKVQSVRIAYYDDAEDYAALRAKLLRQKAVKNPAQFRSFNRDGNETEYRGYDRDGRITTFTLKDYNEKGNISREKVFDENKKPVSSRCFQYDADGRLIKENYYGAQGNLAAFYSSEYDDNGNLSAYRQHLPGGDVEWTKRYKNDDLGNPVHFVQTDAHGRTMQEEKTAYSYQNGKNVQESVLEILSGSDRGKLITTFDPAGNKVEEKAVDPHGNLLGSRIYTYDAENRLIEEATAMPDGTIMQKITRDYDDRGNPKKVRVYGPNDRLENTQSFSYDYDQHDNWIVKVESRDGADHLIVHREIAYHL